jgi:hypothetical protein
MANAATSIRSETPTGFVIPVNPPHLREFSPQTRVADCCDRLVRHLFDVGLWLNAVRVVFDHSDATPADIRDASDAVGDALDELDRITRDAGLTMLTLARDHDITTPADGRG